MAFLVRTKITAKLGGYQFVYFVVVLVVVRLPVDVLAPLLPEVVDPWLVVPLLPVPVELEWVLLAVPVLP